jgi:hypothetical protein
MRTRERSAGLVQREKKEGECGAGSMVCVKRRNKFRSRSALADLLTLLTTPLPLDYPHSRLSITHPEPFMPGQARVPVWEATTPAMPPRASTDMGTCSHVSLSSIWRITVKHSTCVLGHERKGRERGSDGNDKARRRCIGEASRLATST